MDIAILIETARNKGLVSAAKSLGVDHTTAFRRLKSFETRLGYSLFDRSEREYVLTQEGHKLIGLAETLEADVFAFERAAFARDVSEAGTIRVTMPDSLGLNYFPRLLKNFRELHPAIEIEISVRNQFFNLSKREADIAIRPARQLEGDMVARNAAPMAFGLYASHAYLAENGEPSEPAELSQHTICGFDEALSGIGSKEWLNQKMQGKKPQYRFDNTTTLLNAVKSDLGIGICPCFMGDADSKLKRITCIQPDQSTSIWVATHPEVRHAARVRAFVEFAYQQIRSDRKFFAGMQ